MTYYFLTTGRIGDKKTKLPQHSFTLDEILKSSRLALPEAFLFDGLLSFNCKSVLFNPDGDQYQYNDHLMVNWDELGSEIYKFRKESPTDQSTTITNPKSRNHLKDQLLAKIKQKIIDEVTTFITEECLVDKTRVSGNDTCSLSQEKFVYPCYLNLTGRTYELNAFKSAIEATLYQDNPLRLEDITISPEMVGRIVLTPNRSLSHRYFNQWRPDPERVRAVPFSLERIRRNNLPDFSPILRRYFREKDDNGMWLYPDLWAEYARRRDLDTNWPFDTVYIRDLEIHRTNVLQAHPKCNDGQVIFKNCHFIDSLIVIDHCWCGISFEDCQFTKCQMVYLLNDPPTMKFKGRRCRWMSDCISVEYSKFSEIKWLPEED